MDRDIAELRERFGIAGVLGFQETATGLTYAAITTAHARATVYLQGAHLAQWQPAGQGPVLFVSRKSELRPGRPIRGGVPIAFPWFANRQEGKAGPSHGFARIEPWTLAFAALAGEDLRLTFTLGPTAMSRELGYDRFRLAYELTIGRTLTMQLTVANVGDRGDGAGGGTEGNAPLVFEEALHSYFAVTDVHEASVTGLEGVTYLDKTEHLQAKIQKGAVTVTGPIDRIYTNHEGTCVLRDGAGRRLISVAKTGSKTTVVWNPWETGAAKLPDMEASEWHEFLCIETVNAAANRITLRAGESHTMRAQVSVEGEEEARARQ